MIRDGEAVSGDPRDPDSGQCSGGTGRGWPSLGPLLSLWEPPLLPCSPPRLSVSCRPGEWEKAERPRAGDGANSLVTPQQELGARGAGVIHQRDCPLPACVGRDASTFYLYPPRRTWWEAEVQHRARARKSLEKGEGWSPRPGTRTLCGGCWRGGHVAPARAGRAREGRLVLGCQLQACGEGGCWAPSSTADVPSGGICLRGSRGWGGAQPHPSAWLGFPPGRSPQGAEGRAAWGLG